LWSPEQDRALLLEAAEAAGQAALSFFGQSPKVWEKDAGAGPVSEADLAANAILMERLRDARPGYGWLSEETPDDAARLSCERVFIVDPIDGTKAFIAGEAGWCVALAVAERGALTAAAAVFPALGAAYAAHEGGGATRDGAAIVPSAREALEGAHVLAGAPQMDPRHWIGPPPALRRSFRPAMVHRMVMVAEGSADAAISFRDTWEWDAAAGELIAREAGCAVTDGFGRPWTYNAPRPRSAGLVAAPPRLHAAVMARRRVD
jgi:myo-inositol-1(or 4)-monophosphatase